MFLAEPQPTSADWHFEVAGIRVRVSAWFWLAAALLGWNARLTKNRTHPTMNPRGTRVCIIYFHADWTGQG